MSDEEEKLQEVVLILQSSRDLGPEYDRFSAEQILSLTDPQRNPHKAIPQAFRSLSPASQRRIVHQLRRQAHLRSPVLSSLFIVGLFAVSIPLMGIAAVFGHIPGVLGVLGLDALASFIIWRMVG